MRPRPLRRSRRAKMIDAPPSVAPASKGARPNATVAASIHVRPLEESACSRWDDFVYRQPQGTFFHLTGWMRVICKTFGYTPHYLYAERDGQIGAVAPLFWVKNWILGRCL